MAPLQLSTQWYRRFFAAILSVGVILIVFFALQFFSTKAMLSSGELSVFTAVGAALSVALSGVGLIFSYKKPDLLLTLSIPTYCLLIITVGYSVIQTGGVASPFLILWGILALTSPLVGAWGWILIIILTGSFLAGSYLSQDLTLHNSIAVSLTSILPLTIGLFLFRETTQQITVSGTNVKHLASQLSEVAAKSEIIINAIGDGVIAIDSKGIVQLINPAAQSILGWGKQDALLLSYKSILKLSDEQGTELKDGQSPVQQVLNTNQQMHAGKLATVTKSGKKLSISLTASPIDAAGSGVIIIFRDTTKERAEEREQAEFISTASHEMRTPVASIEGYLGLALNPSTATIDQRAHDFIKKAQDSAAHLGRLFQDLLDVSKSEDGRMTSTPKTTDLTPFVQSLTEGLLPRAQEKNLNLIFNPATASAQKRLMPVYYVHQDTSHMREIIDNLIENAIKYTPQGEVVVDITGTEDRVVVSVKDTGLGIPKEDLSHLFQKFYRIDNVDRQEIGGTGLGLYLARRLAESMEGRIWAESEFGKGSTFFFEIPRISTQEAEQLKQQEAMRIQAAGPQPTQTAAPIAPPAVPPVTAPQPVTQAPAPVPQPQPIAQPAPVAPAPTMAPQPTPQATPAPVQAQTQAQPVQAQPVPTVAQRPPVQSTPSIKPATTVPRGESLTRDQIAERVRQLEQLSLEQRQQNIGR